MGIFGASGSSKTDLIRLLLIERISNDPEAKAQGYSPFMVRQLPDSQVLATIEAGIVSIVETLTSLTRKGASNEEAILRIEQHRKSIGHGILPNPLTLENYINYRVGIEHTGAEFPNGHALVCTEAAEHFFAYLDDKGEAAHSVKFALLQQKETKLATILTVLANHLDGETTEEELFESLESDVLSWKMELAERERNTAKGQFLRHLRSLE